MQFFYYFITKNKITNSYKNIKISHKKTINSNF